MLPERLVRAAVTFGGHRFERDCFAVSFTISRDGNMNLEHVDVFLCTSPDPMSTSCVEDADWMNQAVKQK